MKKLLSILLTLAMLLPTFGALPASAADGGNDASANDETQFVAEVYEADGSLQGSYKSVSMAMVCACENTGNRKVKLLADSIENAPVNVTGGSATLDLNGHKLKRDRENNMSDKIGSVIMLGESAELKIIDSSDAKSGTIEGGGAKWGGGIYAPKNNVVIMEAGTITHCTAYYGGGVYVDESSKFIMNGGKISNCYAKYGGGVYVEDKATFETNGGQIINNIAEEDGGGIYVWSAYANINNCYIGHNHADEGGGIYSDYNSSKIYSYVTISRSTIEGNTAQSGYGGIYHCDGSLTLKDGTTVVENSTNGRCGGGVYSEKCTIGLGGSVWIYGNTANSYEPSDVSFGKDLDSAFSLVDSLDSDSFIGVNPKPHKPKAWYSDMHISYYHQCNKDDDLPKIDPLKDALFSNNLSTGFISTFYSETEDYSSTVKQRHYLKVEESGYAVRDSLKATNVIYQNITLPQSDFSSSYDPARRTLFVRVPKYVKDYSSLSVMTDNKDVNFYDGSRLTSSAGWGRPVSTRYGLVVQNVNESPSYTVTVDGGTIDGITPDASGVSSAQKEFFDELNVQPVVPDGKMFSHWEVEGDYTTDYIIGYNQYTKIPLGMLMPNGNVKFTAVFKDKVTEVDVYTTSPKVGNPTPFYDPDGRKESTNPCVKATVVYKTADNKEFKEEKIDVTWQKQQEMFDGTAIHYFDYYANYLANFRIEDTEDGDFCLADDNELKFNLYINNELVQDMWNVCDKRYEYVYGDGYRWRLNNDNNPIKQRILYATRYYKSEKSPIRKSIPAQISVPQNMSKDELVKLLPESVNVQIADINYGKGTEQAEVTHSPVAWNTDNLPAAVTERLEIKGTYKTGNQGFEVKAGDNIYPSIIVVPKTTAMTQMPQVTVDGTPLTEVDGKAKIAIDKKIKLVTSMDNATIYYKLNGGALTRYTPDAEIELKGVKDAVNANTIEAYAQSGNEKSETLNLTIEVDNKTTYTVTILDPSGSKYRYCEGDGEHKLGEKVSVNLHKKFMKNPFTMEQKEEDVYDPFKYATTWSAKGIVLTGEQLTNHAFDFEMPDSNVTIKIETFNYKDQCHSVTIVDKDGSTYEYALGAGEYKEGDTVTIDSTQFMLKGVDDDGVITSEKTTAIEKVVSQWSAEGIELTDAQKKASKFEFKMPYNDVIIKPEDTRPLVKNVYLSSITPVAGKPLPDKLEILSATDINGNVIDKKDIWLKTQLPTDAGFSGMWVDYDTTTNVDPGALAEQGKTYWTFFSVDPSVSGEKVYCDDSEIFMDGKKIDTVAPHTIVVQTKAINDKLLAVDWGGDRELFYSKDDAKASLVNEVKVRTKYGTIDTAKVTWDGAEELDSDRAYGDFPVTATLTLPDYVEDPNSVGTKQLTIKVRKHIDSVTLTTVATDKEIRFPARQGDDFPTKADLKISNQGEDAETVIGYVRVTNKAGNNVILQRAQAGEEYTITVSIEPNTDYAVLSDNTMFTIKDNELDKIGNTMKIIGKSANPTSGRSDVYEVSYTFVAQELNSYPLYVNGKQMGRGENGNTVKVTIKDTAGFDHWTAEAVYTEDGVEYRFPINPFKDGAEYDPVARFVMPMLVDDNASLYLTANYSYGITSYDSDTKTAKIIADKAYDGIKVIFAAYDKSDKLVSVSLADANLAKGENTVTAPEDFVVKDGEILKIMVWNNMEDMVPLFGAFEQTYEKKTDGTGGTESAQSEE